MSHDLEQGENGEVAFASLRVPGWHSLGTVFQDEVDTEGMLRLSHTADWNVRTEPIKFGKHKSHRSWYSVIRDNPFTDKQTDVLGVVGKRYKVLQNEELFDFGDAMLDAGRWETAGSIKNGTVVFASLALDRETNIAGDLVNNYLLVHTSHDGSVAIQASITPVRVVCQNTLNMALRGAKQTFKIRHTQKADDKITAAKDALGLADKYIDIFEAEATALMDAKVTDDQFWDIINFAYPAPEKDAKGSLKKWETKTDLIWDIWHGDTQTGIVGTGWGAVNALTERLDWYRQSRGGNDENIFAARSGFDPVINAEKGRLLNLVKDVVLV